MNFLIDQLVYPRQYMLEYAQIQLVKLVGGELLAEELRKRLEESILRQQVTSALVPE
jgi:hypothetical protein